MRAFNDAEQWYKKSLAIKEKQGDEHGAASTYHQLGMIALEQRDFAAAEQWYKKSLAIKEKQGNEHGAAITYNEFGRLARLQENYADAAAWYLKALPIFLRFNDPHSFLIGAGNSIHAFQAADPATQTLLRQQWQQAGLDRLSPLDQLEQYLNEHN